MPAERPSSGRRVEKLTDGKWLVHKKSQNKFRITRIHSLHAEVLNDDGTAGYVNLDLLLHDMELGLYKFESVRRR